MTLFCISLVILKKNRGRISGDIDNFAKWFEENELIINLKPGKSEVLVF